jgi:hypothetical protein
MRTTLSVDDRVLDQVKALARQRQRPFRETLELLLLAGLKSLEHGGPAKPFTVTPFHCGLAAGVDPQRLNQALDEGEVERFTTRRVAEG